MAQDTRHQCLIYSGAPSRLIPALAAELELKLRAGYRCMYLNNEPMVAGMRSALSARGMDLERETSKGSLIFSSVPIVSGDDVFDADKMLQQLEDGVNEAVRGGYKGLWATGDMTWEFGSEKNFEKLTEYEYGLEKLFRKRPELCGICQYHTDSIPIHASREALRSHSSLFISDTLSRISPFYNPMRSTDGRLATNDELDEMISTVCELQSAN